MGLLDYREHFRPFEYEPAFEFMKAQHTHPWTHAEIEVNQDLMQYHTEFTEAEKHGVNTVLKLFTTYEIHVADYWIDVIYKFFPKPEIRMMAQVFSAMEAEHALFYDKLNNALDLSTKEFYLEFTNDPAMKERVDFIKKMLVAPNRAKKSSGFHQKMAESIAAFTFIEGVILYSSFAFLLSFQKSPKNKLTNVSKGLRYSTRDECMHADAGSWLFKQFVHEFKDKIDHNLLKTNIIDMAKASYSLEEKIIDQIFLKGDISGITTKQLKEFVKSRINKKLADIYMKSIYTVKDNPISSWFYEMINEIEFVDFFATNSTSYTHDWNFDKLKGW